MSCILRDPALEKCWWNGQARGPIDFPMKYHPPAAQVQPLDAVALTAPGIRYDILRSLLGGLHGVEWELLLPLPAHIGRSLIKPECLKITGLPVQLKADDLLNFRKRQCNRLNWFQCQGQFFDSNRYKITTVTGEKSVSTAWPPY